MLICLNAYLPYGVSQQLVENKVLSWVLNWASTGNSLTQVKKTTTYVWFCFQLCHKLLWVFPKEPSSSITGLELQFNFYNFNFVKLQTSWKDYISKPPHNRRVTGQ